MNLKIPLFQVGCKAALLRIWSFHIFIHNISSFQNLKRRICKIQRKAMKNRMKKFKIGKAFPTPLGNLVTSILEVVSSLVYCGYLRNNTCLRWKKIEKTLSLTSASSWIAKSVFQSKLNKKCEWNTSVGIIHGNYSWALHRQMNIAVKLRSIVT